MIRSSIGRPSLRKLITSCMVILFSPGIIAAGESYSVATHTDISYVAGSSNPKQQLDIYQPEGRQDAPVIFFAYGAGWSEEGMSERSLYRAFGDTMAGYYGYVTVVVDTRQSPEVIFPSFMEDLADAYVWVMNHIEAYGGDRANVFLVGHSSGAHMVALLATDSSYLTTRGYNLNSFAGVIPISGTYNLNLLPRIYDDMIEAAFGSLDPETLSEASPTSYVGRGLRPFLVLHAQTDMPACTSQAIGLYGELRVFGNDADIQVLTGLTHVTEIAELTPDNPDLVTAVAISTFIDTHLR